MPFMLGSKPIRRTLDYLEAGKIVLRETVKVFSINFTPQAKNHKGIKDFVYWHLDQIQYKNPTVQCITIKNLTPSPLIRIFFENTKDIIINVDCREKEDILNHLVNFTAVCKSKDELSEHAQKPLSEDDSLFGYGCKRHCMCEIMGQVPCPMIVKLPKVWRRLRQHDPKNFFIPYYYTEKGLDEVDES